MILLSAGHYPNSPGACNGDYCEYPVAVRWVDRIKDILGDSVDVDVVPTGTLTEKVKYINSRPATAAVEIHFNANIKAYGSETLYAPGSTKGKALAESIQHQFQIRNIFQPNRGAKEGWYRMDRPGIVDYVGDVDGDEVIDYFLRATKCPAVIVEPEFIYNKDRIEQWFFEGCDAITQGILEWYQRIKGV